MKPDARAWRHFEAAYGFALRLYPRAFRERWGDAMRQAFRDRCREVARGERNVPTLLAESCTDLVRSLAGEHCRSMEEAPMKSVAIALAVVLSTSYFGREVWRGLHLGIGFVPLLLLAPSLLFLLRVARPSWPLRLAALVLNGLMLLWFASSFARFESFLPVLMRVDPLTMAMMVGLGLVSPVLNLLVLLRQPRRAMPPRAA